MQSGKRRSHTEPQSHGKRRTERTDVLSVALCESPTRGFVFSTDAYGLPLGPNTFVVAVYDRAGNRAEVRATMTRVE